MTSRPTPRLSDRPIDLDHHMDHSRSFAAAEEALAEAGIGFTPQCEGPQPHCPRLSPLIAA